MYYQGEHQQMSKANCGTWGLEGLGLPLWPSFCFTENSKRSNSSVWQDLWNSEEMFLMPLLLDIWWNISEFYQIITFPFHSASLMKLSSHIFTVYSQAMPNCFKLSHPRYPCGKVERIKKISLILPRHCYSSCWQAWRFYQPRIIIETVCFYFPW